MAKPFVKKIISGAFKGKSLKLPSLETTRSSKTIVLESFFNTLQFDIIDAVFVECFAGSGSIGLEALSRGAAQIYFMELDRAAQKVLRENINQTNPTKCEIFSGDTFVNIEQVVARLRKRKSSAYFYIDPPFSYREGQEKVYEKMITMIAGLPRENVEMIIVEHMSALQLPENIGVYKRKKLKKFGKTSLSYYRGE